MCLIVATSRGSLILVNLGTLDELESADFKLDQSRCLYKPIQKTETPVMVKVLDDDGNPHRTGRLPPANEHYIVYVVATGIKIILVSKRAPSEVLKEKELKYKDGLILQSEIFTVGETPFLACITSIGSIRVYSLPDVKHQSTTTMPLESFDANTLMNSFVSSSGFLTLWSQPGELQTYRIAQKSQT